MVIGNRVWRLNPTAGVASVVGWIVALAVIVACSSGARADTAEYHLAKFASDEGNLYFLTLGVFLPLATAGKEGRDHTLRIGDALCTDAILTEALKSATHEKRPDGDGYDSFPSGHASAAFAVATAESHFHPKQAPYWYAGATLIAWSRVRLDRHSAQDVVAGAALGTYATRWTLDRPGGVILTPWIHRRHEIGLRVTKTF
jgi:membrane-associated phospholipid phosphatase